MMLYTQNDLQMIQRQKRQRIFLMLIPALVLLAGVIASLAIRVMWLTIVLTALLGAELIACQDLLIRPLTNYEKHLKNMLHGRTREVEGAFSRISEDITEVDGVDFHAVLLIEYDEKGRPYDRLVYFDAMKEFPEVQPGEQLRLLVHDKAIVSLSKGTPSP
ncbi:MAG: hypothetical protein E7333_07315 [Clostridiales bacterium]|nr:hypothetical protein [Clostridiales bacterium]